MNATALLFCLVVFAGGVWAGRNGREQDLFVAVVAFLVLLRVGQKARSWWNDRAWSAEAERRRLLNLVERVDHLERHAGDGERRTAPEGDGRPA